MSVLVENAPLELEEVIATVQEFGCASLELVAWEFSVPESTVVSLWDHAIRRGSLTLAGRCPATGELMFRAAA